MAEMSFLCRVTGLSLRDRVRVIQKRLKVKPPLLRMEKSQLRWFRHLVRMPPARCFRYVQLGEDHEADP